MIAALPPASKSRNRYYNKGSIQGIVSKLSVDRHYPAVPYIQRATCCLIVDSHVCPVSVLNTSTVLVS